MRPSLREREEGVPWLRGRQLGDGMGGGRNGHFWGAPIFGQNPGKYSIFQGFDAKSGRPKNNRSHQHPSHPPVDALLMVAGKGGEGGMETRGLEARKGLICQYLFRGLKGTCGQLLLQSS